MSLVSSIRVTLSGIGAKFADGVVEYRTMTSAPNAAARTYSAWTVLPVSRCVEFGESQINDPDDNIWYREETCMLRVPFQANVSLRVSDQIRQGAAAGASATNIVWSVRNQGMSAAGAVQAYQLYRRTPMIANPRHGGV